MATYAEIAGLLSPDDDSGLREKVYVAALVKAEAIRNETDDATQPVRTRKRYSQNILKSNLDPIEFRSRGAQSAIFQNAIFESVYRAVVIANISFTLAQITGATDSTIQSAVDDAIDHLASSYNDPETP